jgi:hypothetical protein
MLFMLGDCIEEFILYGPAGFHQKLSEYFEAASWPG